MRRIVIKVAQKLYYFLFLILGKLPANQNLIVFESFLGKQYSDNPRAIYEYLREHYPNYKMYWSMEKSKIAHFQQKEIEMVPRLSLKWVLLMSRARYWVTNSRLPLWIPKPQNTIYIQTWHGTPLKKLALDMDEVHMPGTNTESYKKNFLYEASKWDYLISPNKYSSEIFKRAFQFKKSLIESGYPRNDYLIQNKNNTEEIIRVKKVCGIHPNKKVILYAPTWRDNQFYKVGKYKFDLQLDLQQLKKSFDGEYVVILRLHYLVAENLDFTEYENFVYDCSEHEDIRELYLISDLLITDYSSVFFDYANLNRPILFYVYDLEEYRDTLRGFYFNFENNAPGPLLKTTKEIIAEISNFKRNPYQLNKSIKNFYEKFSSLEDGYASERVVNEIFKG